VLNIQKKEKKKEKKRKKEKKKEKKEEKKKKKKKKPHNPQPRNTQYLQEDVQKVITKNLVKQNT